MRTAERFPRRVVKVGGFEFLATTSDPSRHSDPSVIVQYPRPDRGPSDFASGRVSLDAEGIVTTYTFAPGDAGSSIGERFCIDYVSLMAVNDARPTPQPGQVLTINP